MNVLIPDSWLREHLKTKAKPEQVAKYLSLCSQSVEKVIKKGKDWVYEIEISTNRSDCLSVYGIARELAVILPRFGVKAQLKKIPEEKLKIPQAGKSLPLSVEIKKSSLCPRFTAIIFDKIAFKPSPKIIQERLEKSGVRALDNVVDISNYLMLELGQPMHAFDYDKIKGAKMILGEAREGEETITLDGIKRKLPQGAIIVKDGAERIIDLCGIMGAENSSVDKNTKRVLLFVQIYDPIKIRQACQGLAFRTEASSRFEKGVDPEGIILAMKKAIKMFGENTGAKVASDLIDIYSSPPRTKKVTLSQNKLSQAIGVKISLSAAKEILANLGFKVALNQARSQLIGVVPHWRKDDIAIPEDLVEEVARVYGYFNLPSRLPTGDFPEKTLEKVFYWEEKIKDCLKHQGFTEVYSYSMVSADLLEKANFDPQESLKIKNPLTQEWEYLRTSLIPSALQVVAKNQDRFEEIKIFELANQYLPRVNQLPKERSTLTGMVTGEDQFRETRGAVEALLEELGIREFQISPAEVQPQSLWHPQRTISIIKGKENLGYLGEIHPEIITNFGIKSRVVAFRLNAPLLTKLASTKKPFVLVAKYPPIVEHLSFVVPPKTYLGPMIQAIKQTSPLVQSIELLDSFKQTMTLRIIYQHPKRNLTTKEVKKVRNQIKERLRRKFRAVFKER